MKRLGSATVVLVIAGVAALGAAIRQGVATWRFLDGAVHGEGRVVDASLPSRPVVVFETARG